MTPTFRFSAIAMLACVLLLTTQLFSQHELRLTNAVLHLEPIDSFSKKQLELMQSGNESISWIGSFNHIPSREQMSSLETAGFRLVAKLDSTTFVFLGTTYPKPSLAKQSGLIGMGLLRPEHKLSNILQKRKKAIKRQGDDRVDVIVHLYPGFLSSDILHKFPQDFLYNPEAPFNSSSLISGSIPGNSLLNLAKITAVSFIDVPPPPSTALNDNARAMSGAFKAQADIGAGGYGLTGKGITVGIGDDGGANMHPDLYDRQISISDMPVMQHASHVSGTVGAAGILAPRFKGMAPECTLINDLATYILTHAREYYNKYGMVITNNSYAIASYPACSHYGSYDGFVDQIALEAPNVAHVCAAGNSGDEVCNPFPQHYHTILGGGQSAKNIITVGRTDYNQLPSGSSSSGPTSDGRLKPEITALGIIYSCNANGDGYWGTYGTSQSSPVVAGGLALLYERYHQLNGNNNPTSALAKALALNGARDVFTAGPDYRTGFGTIMVNRSLRMLDRKTYTEDSLAQDETRTINISIPAGQTQLKAMLYWHDQPGDQRAVRALVNDLDLELVDPTGKIFNPLILDPQNVEAPAKQGIDRINNVEQVVINLPVAGSYQLQVKNHFTIGNSQQPFSLVWDYFQPTLQILAPYGGVVMGGYNNGISIHWQDEGLTQGSYNIDYSTDNGQQWISIVSGLKDTCRNYYWENIPANTVSTEAFIRITKAALVATSPKFSLLPYVKYSLAPSNEQCPGYIKLKWTNEVKPTEIDGYEVLLKRGDRMESIARLLPDALEYAIRNLSKDSIYYTAVIPLKNGIKGSYNFAAVRQPNNGNCLGNISDKDLLLDSILLPRDGRLFTSTALTQNQKIKVRIKNLDDQPYKDGFTILLNISDSIQLTSGLINTTIPAMGSYLYEFPAMDFSKIGSYTLSATIGSSNDSNLQNNTFTKLVKQLPNPVINFTNNEYAVDFNTVAFDTLYTKTFGLPGLDAWDFNCTGLYNNITTYKTDDGNTGIRLSTYKTTTYSLLRSKNIQGTFNLTKYVDSSNIWIETSSSLLIRGADTLPWLSLEPTNNQYWFNISDTLKKYNQKLSSSTQVCLGSLTTTTSSATYSIDKLRFAIIPKITLTNLQVNLADGCINPPPVRLSFIIKNTLDKVAENLYVWYVIGTSDTGYIPISIPLEPGEEKSMAIEVSMGDNSFGVEISAGLNVEGYHIPLKSTINFFYPYYTMGWDALGWYADDCEDWSGGNRTTRFIYCGTNVSWEWGTPSGEKIYTAPNGSMAHKTSLSGHYNNNEFSYFYFPKIRIAEASTPMLSFLMAYDILQGDSAWMEYSTDNIYWKKLGRNGQGTNWYNTSEDVWTDESKTHWHVASIPLPKEADTLFIRMAFKSDAQGTAEGVAIDLIHTYDLPYNIYATAGPSQPVEKNITGSDLQNYFTSNGEIIAALQTNENLGNIEAKTYLQPVNNNGAFYYGPRITSLKPENSIDEIYPYFFFTDADIDSLRLNHSCTGCKNIKDFTEAKYVFYSDKDPGKIDNSLLNNVDGIYNILDNTAWMLPYLNGYMIQTNTSSPTEFWLATGDISAVTLPTTWLSFEARQTTSHKALLKWETANETHLKHYEVQRSVSHPNNYISVGKVIAKNDSYNSYQFTDDMPDAGIVYYRIKSVDMNGKISYSSIRTVSSVPQGMFTVNPNPAHGRLTVQVQASGVEKALLTVKNIHGASVISQPWQLVQGNNQLALQLSLPAGTYVIELHQSKGIDRIKIVNQ
jgi:hypothetical protein